MTADPATDRASLLDALVDEAGMGSFPASDPPSFWAGIPEALTAAPTDAEDGAALHPGIEGNL